MASLRTRRPHLDPDAFIAAAEDKPVPEQSAEDQSAPRGQSSGMSEPKPLARTRAANGREGRDRPWEAPGVRPDVTKAFNLRLPEPLKLKLDFIRDQTRISIHEFIMDALTPAIDLEIQRLEKQKK